MSAVRAWRVQPNGERVIIRGYYCDGCDEDHYGITDTELWEEGKAFYCTDRIGDEEQYFGAVSEENVWWCQREMFFHDTMTPEPVFAWMCDDCESLYLDKEDAEQCC